MCRVGPVGSGLPLRGVEKRPRRGCAHGSGLGRGLRTTAPIGSATGCAERHPTNRRRGRSEPPRGRFRIVAHHAAQGRPDPTGPTRQKTPRERIAVPVVCVGGGHAGGAPPVDPAGRVRPTLSGATRADLKTSRSGPVGRRRGFAASDRIARRPNRFRLSFWITPAAAGSARTRRGGAFFPRCEAGGGRRPAGSALTRAESGS